MVRRATTEDAIEIRAVLGRALAGDPFVRWLTRGKGAAMHRYFKLMVNQIALPKGVAYVAASEPDAPAESVALWAPPHTFELSAGESLRMLPSMIHVIGPWRFSRVSAVLDAVEQARPPEPRWLLTLLATLPERRRRGLASAVLAPALARCDADEVVAVCETSEPKNLPFYARHGFEVVSERTLGPSGPPSYTLVREPRRKF